MSGKAQSHGTKVTDPHSTIQESTGAVASDSLAAQSQAFKSENKNAEPLGVSGSNSTFATTDTSGATKLAPAHDASERLSSTDRQGIYPDNVGGQDKAAAVEATYKSQSGGGDNNTASQVTEPAPTYVNQALNAADLHDGQKPKGKNLHEVKDPAEFERAKNASFTTDIGSEQDPARLAEKKFETRTAESVTAAGVPNKEGTREKPYEVLSDDTPA